MPAPHTIKRNTVSDQNWKQKAVSKNHSKYSHFSVIYTKTFISPFQIFELQHITQFNTINIHFM